jgi:hypothetical protein
VIGLHVQDVFYAKITDWAVRKDGAAPLGLLKAQVLQSNVVQFCALVNYRSVRALFVFRWSLPGHRGTVVVVVVPWSNWAHYIHVGIIILRVK